MGITSVYHQGIVDLNLTFLPRVQPEAEAREHEVQGMSESHEHGITPPGEHGGAAQTSPFPAAQAIRRCTSRRRNGRDSA